jgi:hypothetical protein
MPLHSAVAGPLHQGVVAALHGVVVVALHHGAAVVVEGTESLRGHSVVSMKLLLPTLVVSRTLEELLLDRLAEK